MTKIKDLVSISKGRKAPLVFDTPTNGSERYLQIEDLRPNPEIKYARDKKGVLAKENDVVIAWDGANAGTVGFGLRGYIGSTLAVLKFDEKDVCGSFIGYLLQSKFDYIHNNCTGATIPHVDRRVLENIDFFLPDLLEQQRIVGILARADRLRQLRRYALQLSEGYLQSIFLQMFGDPVTNPMGWETGLLKQLCQKIVDCPHTTPKYEPVETPYACVRSSDIQNGFFDWSTTKYVSFEEYQTRIQRLKPIAGDVVYCREGARFGNAARIPCGKTVCLGQRTMLFRANEKVATPEFTWAYLESDSAYRQAVKLSGGSASPHVNVGDIKAFHVTIPPIQKQRAFSQVVHRFERLRAQQHEAARQAEHLFATLLYRAFRGEL